MMKVMIDLDDTTADFLGQFSHLDSVGPDDVTDMYEPGFFLRLKPVPGALKAVRDIIRLGYDVWFLTQPLAESSDSYKEKVQWVGLHFPELIGKIIMTQDKGHIRGDYLIDDNAKKWQDKWEANGQTFIHFIYNRDDRDKTFLTRKQLWERIVNYLRAEKKKRLEQAGNE